MLLSRRDEIAAFAARQRIPAIHFDRQYAVGGGLISYGTSVGGMYHQAGVYSGQILKGAKPAEMPVLQPTKFELVVNSQDRQCTRPRNSAGIACTRRRGHRVTLADGSSW